MRGKIGRIVRVGWCAVRKLTVISLTVHAGKANFARATSSKQL